LQYYLISKLEDNSVIPIEIILNSLEGIANRRAIPADNASFNIMKTGALEFTILTYSPSSAKHYTIMDMMGQVISVVPLNEASTHVKVPTAGSYVVKAGHSYKRVNMK